MLYNANYGNKFRRFVNGTPVPHSGTFRGTAFLVLAAALVMALAAGAMLHAGGPGQTIVPYQSADDTGLIPDLAAFAPLPGYAFAQTPPDDTPPIFVSSGLNMTTENLTITFSEAIDAANVVPAGIHIRESGNYTHGVTLTAGELDTTADGATISFTLNDAHLVAVAAMGKPELTIDPGAVRDTSGNLIVGTFDASTRTFVDATSIKSQERAPTGMTFSSDGTKMFVIGDSSNAVNEYALSAPFDVSTRTFIDSVSVVVHDIIPTGIAFSDDGTRLFMIGISRDAVNEYHLPAPFAFSAGCNPWNACTFTGGSTVPPHFPERPDATYVDATSIRSQEVDPRGMAFSSDGTKMFVVGDAGDDVNEYTLSAPFDASTRTFVDATSISEQETFPTGIAFSSNGTKMFVIGNSSNAVNEYHLPTPFDASTLDFVDATSISEQETIPTDIAFSNDGTKMFVLGTRDNVNEYDLSSVYPIEVTGMASQSQLTSQSQQASESQQASAATLDPVGTPGPRDIGRIILTSTTPGTIEASWVAPSEAPANYRISWAKVGDPYLTWTDSTGNAFPTDPAHTITGLEAGETYNVKVRASYSGTAGDWSGDVTITIAEAATNTIAEAATNTIAVPDTPVSTVVTDTTAPTISSIERYSPSSATTDSQTLTYKVTFSEDVTGVGTADFALSSDSTGNTNGNNPVTSISGSGSVYYAEVSASTDGTYNLDLVSSGHGIADESSNPLTDTTPTGADETYTVSTTITDTTAPTISSIERYNPSSATTDSQTLVYRITFSEDVTGVGTADFALSPGSTGGTSTSSGQFTQTRSPALAITQANTISDTITVSDSGTATSVSVAVDVTHTYIGDLKIDLVAPDGTTKTVHSRSGGGTDDIDQTYTPDFEGESIAGTWTLRINDNYAAADDGILNSWTLTINHGSGTTTNPVTSISGSGDTYYATVSSTQDGTYNLDLVSSGHGIADESSNPLTDTTPTGADETYTVSTTITDTTAPTISSIERYSPSSATTDSQTLVYRITFSEDVAGVGTADFALSPGSTGGTSTSSGQFTQTRSPALAITQANTISDTITVSDSGTATSVSVAVDVTHTYIGDLKIDLVAPDGTTKTVHSRSGGGTDDIDQTYTPDFEGESIAGTWTLRINDSYAAADDGILNSWTLTINHGSGTTTNPVTSVSGSGDTYYATVSSTQDGTYNLDLVSSGHGIADTASNPLANTTPTGADETYTVSTTVTDTTAPTISSIERYNPSSATTDSQTLVYRITFSEDVTGVGTADFALSSDSTGNTNGNNPVTSISGFGDTYYATVSSTQDGTYNLDLVSSGHGIADESSNPLANTAPTGADETYTVSTTVVNTANPRLESIERYSPASQNTNTQYLIYKATFSKSVTGVGASDFVLSPGSTGGGNNGSSPIAGISGSGDTYYVIVFPAVDGTYNLDLVSSGHNIADTASNPLANTTPTGADETYTVS